MKVCWARAHAPTVHITPLIFSVFDFWSPRSLCFLLDVYPSRAGPVYSHPFCLAWSQPALEKLLRTHVALKEYPRQQNGLGTCIKCVSLAEGTIESAESEVKKKGTNCPHFLSYIINVCSTIKISPQSQGRDG